MDDRIPDLPDHLRPADGRFGSGPSKVRTTALSALAGTGGTVMGTSHRRDGIKSIVGRIRSGLGRLFALPEGHEVLLGNGGATAFWDAAAFRLVAQRSEHLVFGEFSGKFAAVTTGAPHLGAPRVVESPPGTHPVPEPDPTVDAYALTANETSTGVAMEVARPPAAGLVVVDATSAAGSGPVDPAAYDAYYFSPQKAFGGDGGLWVALCSPAAIARIDELGRSGPWVPPSLDLGIAVENSRKDQTYNTPALATLFLLADQIDWLLAQGGLPWAARHAEAAAEVVYGWAEASSIASPFVTEPAMRSRTVATVDLVDSVRSEDITRYLRTQGIVDIEPYRKLGRNQLRIAMFPNIDTDDLERLTAAIEWTAARQRSAQA